MKRKMISILLICIGIIVLCYPKLTELYDDYQQQELVQEWQQSLLSIGNGNDGSQWDEEITRSVEYSNSNSYATEVMEALPKPKQVNYSEPKPKQADLNEPKPKKAELRVQNIEGMLTIDKINLNLPILHGATNKNLKTTAASIENTGKVGEIGNYALAGHRNLTYGRNFNRLGEIVVGDKIEVDDGEKQFEYTVTEILVVKPEEVWVLKGNGENKEITLITCEPMVNPTHRLIIKGKITE